jgi:hypothetical protein
MSIGNWFDEQEKKGRRPTTQEDYDNYIRNWDAEGYYNETPKQAKERKRMMSEGRLGIGWPTYKYDVSKFGKLLPKNYGARMNRK